jgi:hypothetical protein
MALVDSIVLYLAIGLALLVVIGVGIAIALMRRGEPRPPKPRPGIDYAPGVGDDDTVPRDTPRRRIEHAGGGIDTLTLPEPHESRPLRRDRRVEWRSPNRRGRLSVRSRARRYALAALLALLSETTSMRRLEKSRSAAHRDPNPCTLTRQASVVQR